MALQLGKDAFRTQLVLAEQRELYDYWVSCADSEGRVARSRIHPSRIPRLLPNISLIEVSFHPSCFRYRLAGTKLREIHDRDITGLRIEDVYSGEMLTFWKRISSRVSGTGQPSEGALKGVSTHKEHLVQFWLRLPLTLDAPNCEMILCHDCCLPTAESSEILNLRRDFKELVAAG